MIAFLIISVLSFLETPRNLEVQLKSRVRVKELRAKSGINARSSVISVHSVIMARIMVRPGPKCAARAVILILRRALLGPPDRKNGNFQSPPIRIFISVMVSLGVGKRQTGEVLFKSARVSS